MHQKQPATARTPHAARRTARRMTNTPCTMQRATSQCNMNYPTGRQPEPELKGCQASQMSRACARSQRRRRCSKVHHTCGALRTMRSMQRTPHIVRRLVLGVQRAACNTQRTAYSVQHAPRPIPTAAMRSQTPPLSDRNLHCAAPSVQRATRKHTTFTPHQATRNIPVQHELSHWPARQSSYNPKMQHATLNATLFARHATSNVRVPCAANDATSIIHHATYNAPHATYSCSTHTVGSEDRAPPKRVRCCHP
jgi:hypothetical protein